MQEVLFQAWHKKRKRMYSLVEFRCDEKGVHVFAVSNSYDGPWFGVTTKDVELRQFTGLKDRNGNKIFEGDILKMGDATAKVVFWGKPPEFGLDFYHNEDAWCEDWNLSDDSTRMEIVGNIYEHLELMRSK